MIEPAFAADMTTEIGHWTRELGRRATPQNDNGRKLSAKKRKKSGKREGRMGNKTSKKEEL